MLVLTPDFTDSFKFLPDNKLAATVNRPAPPAPYRFALPAAEAPGPKEFARSFMPEMKPPLLP